MRILLTGGSGFVGSAIASKLGENNHEITALSTNYEKPVPFANKTYYLGMHGFDVTCTEKQDAVIHQMANNNTLFNDKMEMFQANVFGPKKLFMEAVKRGCKKFVYASSTAVYGNSPSPYIEGVTEINPLNYYAESKAVFDEFAMDFAKEEGIDIIGLRYCNVYGPGESHKEKRRSMIGQLIDLAIGGYPLRIFNNGEQKRDWVYIDDVVDANILALNSNLKGGHIFNIGSGKSTTFNEICHHITTATKSKSKIQYIDCQFSETYQSHTECNIEKANRELGFSPKFSVIEGIEKYVYSQTWFFSDLLT